MENKKQNIIDLLNKNVLFREKKEKILSNIDSLSELWLDALYYLLISANQKQSEYLELVIKGHPDFVDFLEEFENKQLAKDRKDRERKVVKEDSKKLQSLEEKLLNV